ncbi:NAD(P)H-quinone oxidoreductase subunit H, chloroplastic [Senna tora]|uniref:NAD(P)H-quinone oxidoreductase subunit H, chloroplastic n=1 Tax=Senna tora TaxID=362788 RepID=A0A834TSS2_9FABA|nr:NAD(P)H-quinone oxidoreductase subunit H, chloroplastic [Senna tora]
MDSKTEDKIKLLCSVSYAKVILSSSHLHAQMQLGLLKVSKLESATKLGSMWNWMSSFVCWSLRELTNPGLRLENALSVGVNKVNPPFEFRSCEFIWFATWVVFRRHIRVVNPPTLFMIMIMSVDRGDDGEGAGANGNDSAEVRYDMEGVVIGGMGDEEGPVMVVVGEKKKKVVVE